MTHAAVAYHTTLTKRPTPAETAAAHAASLVTARAKVTDTEESVVEGFEDMTTDISALLYDAPLNGTIAEIQSWVSDEEDPTAWYAAATPTADQVTKAQHVFDFESAKTSPRSTLITWLDGIPGVITA